jgi:purine-binding chemotaxis protein CheW
MNLDGAMEVNPEKSGVAETGGQYVTFNCCGNAYGIDIMAVREIRSWVPTTKLPHEPHAACGVLDIRGEIVQVYDLGALLGTGRIDASGDHVVLVVSLEGQDVGILADSVSDIIQTSPKDLRPAPNNDSSGGLVQGLIKHEERMVAILDLASVLGS